MSGPKTAAAAVLGLVLAAGAWSAVVTAIWGPRWWAACVALVLVCGAVWLRLTREEEGAIDWSQHLGSSCHCWGLGERPWQHAEHCPVYRRWRDEEEARLFAGSE